MGGGGQSVVNQYIDIKITGYKETDAREIARKINRELGKLQS